MISSNISVPFPQCSAHPFLGGGSTAGAGKQFFHFDKFVCIFLFAQNWFLPINVLIFNRRTLAIKPYLEEFEKPAQP